MCHRISSRVQMILIVCMFGLAACSSASQSQNPATPTAVSTKAPTPQASSTSMLVTPGQVRLVLSKAHYASKEGITVTIVNGLSTSIYAMSSYTDCTPVLLEWQSPKGWLTRGRCPAQSGHGIELKPGSTTPVQLFPVSGVLRPGGASWEAGTYRAIFIYSLKPDEGSISGTSVQSADVTIG